MSAPPLFHFQLNETMPGVKSPGVVPTMPVRVAMRPTSVKPPEKESLLVMVQYEPEGAAFADVCDYQDGAFRDMHGNPVQGQVVAWGLAPEFGPDQIEVARTLNERRLVDE